VRLGSNSDPKLGWPLWASPGEQRTFGGKNSLQQNKEKNKELLEGKTPSNRTKGFLEGKCIPSKNKGFFGGKAVFPPLSRYCATWLIRSYPN